MKEQLAILVRHQNIEIEKAAIQKILLTIPDKLSALDAEFAEFEARLGTEGQGLDELKKAYRTYESEVKDNLSKIKKSRERLNMVKTNKEYQAILKEIEDIEKKNSDIEDIMLEYLEQIDEKEKNFADIKKRSAPLKEKITKEKQTILQGQQDGEKKLSELQKDSEIISAQISPDFLNIYLKVRQRVGNLAVAPVSNAVCSGCNMNIPAQLYNELHRFDSLRYCPFCRRIIYHITA